MFCTTCGTTYQDNLDTCPFCGTSTASGYAHSGSAPYGTSPAYAVPQVIPVQVPAPAPQKNTGNRIAAAIAGCALAATLAIVGIVYVNTAEANARDTEAKAAQSQAAQETLEAAASSLGDTAKEVAQEVSNANVSADVTVHADPAPQPVVQYVYVPTNTAPAPAATSCGGGYMLPDSSSRYYSYGELSGRSNWDLYIARNEIYARHGSGFVRQDLTSYFNGKSWYTKRYSPEQFDAMPSPLNKYESANVQTILSVERDQGSQYI